MSNCPFCAIAQSNAPAHIIHNGPHVMAFMDVNPINDGHVLVIPRVHEPHLQNLDDTVYLEVMHTAKRLARALHAAFTPQRVGLTVAGFDVPHAHLHVLPLHHYHDLTSRRYLERGDVHPPR